MHRKESSHSVRCFSAGFVGWVVLALIFLPTSVQAAAFTTGTVVLDPGSNISMDITVDDVTGVVDFTFTKDDDGDWFGIGFGSTIMSGTYAIIADSANFLSERTLGNHNSGSLHASQDLVLDSDTSAGGIRTLQFHRDLNTGDAADYVFPTSETDIDVIWADGQDAALAFHGSTNFGSQQVSFTETAGSTPPSSEVPEPASFVLLFFGLAGLRFIRRRSRA